MIDFGGRVVQPRKPFCWYSFLSFQGTILVVFFQVEHWFGVPKNQMNSGSSEEMYLIAETI